MPAQFIYKFHKDQIKNERTMPWTMSSMAFFKNQGQITPKWLVWKGQNSNSSEILCLSWLPASLTKIRSRMNMLAWRDHFPIIVYEKFFQCSRACNTEVNDPIWLEFEDFTSKILHLSWIYSLVKIRSKMPEKRWKNHFPIISQWLLLVATTTIVLNQSAPKSNAAFPPLHWCYK